MFSQKHNHYRCFQSTSLERSLYFKQVLRKDIGYFQVVNTPNQRKKKAVVAQKENGAGNMTSNCFRSKPIQKAKKWDGKEKK